MKENNKIVILLPDGVGIRNFIFTDFLKYGNSILWTTSFLASNWKGKVRKIPEYQYEKRVEQFRNMWIESNIRYFQKIFHNDAFLGYLKTNQKKSWRQSIKTLLKSKILSILKPDFFYKKYISLLERTSSYQEIISFIKEEEPDFIFCTHQRSKEAAILILAARKMNILTGTFVFSWDNMPKGNLSVPAEHLFVWSDYMKEEALKYYPFIDENKIHVVGTPQFIPYTDTSLHLDRELFCTTYGLDVSARLICFSGDDVLTSPYDPQYLKDVAKAIRELNQQNNLEKYQILFRRCPVDQSNRYDQVLLKYSDVIVSVNPLWKKSENDNALWNQIMPTKEDLKLLVNIVLHCETAINVGSTIAHDFACMGKTSCYLNYNVPNHGKWDIHKIYRFIHFESMQGLDPVYWINNSKGMEETILAAIDDSEDKLQDSKRWLQRIVKHPLSDANKRIWETINNIVEGNKKCI